MTAPILELRNVTAAYGWTYAGQLPVAVSAWAADDGLSLDFVTPAGARIRATRRARDVFEGTLVAPTGATRAVRKPPASRRAARKPSRCTAPCIAPWSWTTTHSPVPYSCACSKSTAARPLPPDRGRKP